MRPQRVVADPAVVSEAWAAGGEEITFAEHSPRRHDPAPFRIPCQIAAFRFCPPGTSLRLYGYDAETPGVSKASRRRTSDNGLYETWDLGPARGSAAKPGVVAAM